MKIKLLMCMWDDDDGDDVVRDYGDNDDEDGDGESDNASDGHAKCRR